MLRHIIMVVTFYNIVTVIYNSTKYFKNLITVKI